MVFRLRRRGLVAGACLLVVPVSGYCSVSREQLAEFFQPDRIQRVTLSPDGEHVGYVVRESGSVNVVLRQLDEPWVKTAIRVDLPSRGSGPVEIEHLGWASRDWLVYLVGWPDRDTSGAEELHAISSRDHKDRLVLKSSAVRYVLRQPRVPVLRGDVPTIDPLHSVDLPDIGHEVDYQGEPGPVYAARLQDNDRVLLGHDPATKLTFARHLRVLGGDAHDLTILIEAYGSSQIDTDVYRVAPENPELVPVGWRPGGDRVLYDRTGQPRIMETARSVLSHRQSFRVLRAGAPRVVTTRLLQALETAPDQEWCDLDEYLGAGAGFSHDDDRDYFGPRSVPLAFDADPDVLYVASNAGSDCFRIRRLDLPSRKMSELGVGDGGWDLAAPENAFDEARLVFDAAGRLAGVRVPGIPGSTHWISAGGRELQRQVEGCFPGRRADVLSWNDAGTRVLVLTSGPSDPGRYFIFYPGERPRAVEVARRKGALPADQLAVTRSFDFTTSAGVRLVGSVTIPSAPRRSPPPLVVLCRDIPGPGLVGSTYEPAAHALAALGFMVLDVNYRGRAGLGTAHREAVRRGFDRIPLEDIRAAMTYVRRVEPFDVRRVALFGEGFGGYLALRALELYPNEFRSAVVVNAPVDLRWWPANERAGTLTSGGSAAGRRAFFTADPEALAAAPSLEAGGALRQRVLVLRFRDDKAASAVRSTLKARHCDFDITDLSPAVEARDPRALAAAFARIGDFLNGAMFDYRVDVGKEEPVP